MQAQKIITDIATILNDTGGITYTTNQIINAINDAQRLVCIHKPDACTSTSNFSITPATAKQTLPATVNRLLRVTRNMGANGSTPGKAVRSITSIDELSNMDANWPITAGSSVSDYAYDDAVPGVFWIYPVPASTHFLEIQTANIPVDITIATDPIAINDIYAPVLTSWALYRIWSRDSEDGPNYSRAMENKGTAMNLLGIKLSMDAQSSPNSRR
jgi:hypothetical protein